MAINLGDAILYFKGDSTDLDGQSSKIDNMTRNLGMGMTAFGAAVTGAFSLSLAAFADSEAAGAQLDAVLKSTGGAAGMTKDALTALATELQKTTAFEDDAVIKGESLLLTFTNIGKDVFPQATMTMLDMSQALGQDLSSSAIQLGKALNDPMQGMTALSRVGVSFTVEQKEQIKVLQESGDVMGAQKIILTELSKEFGGSAVAAADTLTGKWSQLKNEFGGMMEEIGNALTDGAGFKGLIDSVKNTVVGVTEWIKINPGLSSTIAVVVAGAGALAMVLGPILVMLPGIVTAVGLVGGAFAAISAGPLVAIVAAIAGVGIAFYELVTNFDTVKRALSDWSGPMDAAEAAGSAIGNAFSSLGETIAWAMFNPLEAIGQAISAVAEIVMKGVELMIIPFRALYNVIMDVFAALSQLASTVGLGMLTGFDPSGGTGGMEQRAGGGPVTGNTPYIVGEEGPELFIPSGNGAIMNATDTARTMASGGNSVTVNTSFPNLIIREDADIDRISTLIARQIPLALSGAI